MSKSAAEAVRDQLSDPAFASRGRQATLQILIEKLDPPPRRAYTPPSMKSEEVSSEDD